MNKTELLKDLKKQGFADRIIQAFAKVPREDFIKFDLQKFAYENIALPIKKDINAMAKIYFFILTSF